MYEYMKEMYREYLLRNGNVNSVYIKKMAQIECCKKYNAPHFAPTDGICWSCRKHIYDKIDIIQAANSLITGCPYCNRSYCD